MAFGEAGAAKVVCFALAFEAEGFAPVEGWKVWTLRAAGERAVQKFAEHCGGRPPALCILAGLAGGINPELRAGAVLLDAEEDGVAPGWMRRGKVISVKEVVGTVEDKLRLWEACRADVCDMETGPIRQAASLQGSRIWSVRAVSDDAHTALPAPPRLLAAAAERGSAAVRLAIWLLARPARWVAFGNMMRDARRARSALHGSLRALLREPGL